MTDSFTQHYSGRPLATARHLLGPQYNSDTFWKIYLFCGLFWGPSTPLEIQRAGRNAFRDSAKLQVLLEQWASASGVWRETEFYLSIKQKKRNRRYGCRTWLTRGEMVAKFGSTEIANQIIEAKELDSEAAKNQIRAHPDLHGKATKDSTPCTTWMCMCKQSYRRSWSKMVWSNIGILKSFKSAYYI